MAQIFHRSFNTLARVSLLATALLLATLGVSLYGMGWSPVTTNAKIVRDQPVPFSHAHHVGELGIDCRYCHTTVETAAFAGMPSSQLCMNCHQEIWFGSPMLEPIRASFGGNTPIAWQRVHRLPAFAYFNHSIHVKKGVGCNECHGRVDKMPLMVQEHSLLMSWCVSCHRDPAPYLRPAEEVFSMTWRPTANAEELARDLMKKNRIDSAFELTNCTVCHR